MIGEQSVDGVAVALACRELAARFAICLDLRRFADVAALFTVDGVFHRPNGDVVVGRANIEHALSLRPATLHSIHQVSTVVMEHIAEHEASGWSSFLGFTRDCSTTAPLALRGGGFFHDRYRLVNERWLIAERNSHELAEQP